MPREIKLKNSGRTLVFPDTMSDEAIQEILEREAGKPPPLPSVTNPAQRLNEGPVMKATPPGSDTMGGMAVEPPLMEKLFPEKGRAAMLTGGALGGAAQGAAAGAPGGPVGVAAGTVIGSVLGVTGASFLNDLARQKPFKDQIVNASREAKMDFMLGTGIPAVTRAVQLFGHRAGGAILGVRTEAAKKMADVGQWLGIQIGAIDATASNIVSGAKTILGIFPFISTPFRVSGYRARTQIQQQLNESLDAIAPSASMFEMGIDLEAAARKAYGSSKTGEGFLGLVRKNYDFADTQAIDLTKNGRVIDTTGIRETAESLLRDSAMPKRVVRDELGDVVAKEPIRGKGVKEVDDFLDELKDIEEAITIPELRALQKKLTKMADFAVGNNTVVKELTALKLATEDALSGMNLRMISEQEAAQVKDAYQYANTFYAEGMKTFESAAARKFSLVDRNIFRAGPKEPGTISADEVARRVINLRSSEAIKELRAIVGEKNVHRAARSYLDDTLHSPEVIQVDKVNDTVQINWAAFRNRLGLRGRTVESEALDEMLKGTGINIARLESLIELGESLGPIPLASKFAARRATLGGAQGAVRALTGMGLTGAAGFSGGWPGIVVTVMTLGALRKGASILVDPQTLHYLSRAADPNLPRQSRNTALIKTVNQMFHDDEEMKQALTAEIAGPGRKEE